MTFDEWELLAKWRVAEAQYNLGLIYSKGEEVPRNNEEAVKWYRLSAEQQITGAQSNLGLMYEKGQGGFSKLCRSSQVVQYRQRERK